MSSLANPLKSCEVTTISDKKIGILENNQKTIPTTQTGTVR